MTRPKTLRRRRFSPRLWRLTAVLAAAYALLALAASDQVFNGLDVLAWVVFGPVFLVFVFRLPYYLAGGR